jgi:hypothetical protein
VVFKAFAARTPASELDTLIADLASATAAIAALTDDTAPPREVNALDCPSSFVRWEPS